MPIEQIEEKTLLRKKIYDMLKEAIISGELEPGERIIELELAEKIGISRTPIREAIRQLESKGYFESIEKGGVRVAKISEKEIKDWSEIKNVLNEFAIKKAVNNITYEQLEELEKVLEDIKDAVEEENESKISLKNERFHEIIFEASNNGLIKSIGKEFQNYSLLLRSYLSHFTTRRENAYIEHKKIFEALKNKDQNEAVKLMREHSKNSKEALLEQLGTKKQ